MVTSPVLLPASLPPACAAVVVPLPLPPEQAVSENAIREALLICRRCLLGALLGGI